MNGLEMILFLFTTSRNSVNVKQILQTGFLVVQQLLNVIVTKCKQLFDYPGSISNEYNGDKFLR